MGCKVQYGINNACGDLLFPSGADPDFYVGYVSDLGIPISLTQSGAISSLSFKAYQGLVKFSGQKYSHNFTYDGQKGAGGNLSIIHRASVRLINLSVQDDVELQRLMQSVDAFIIGRNNNDQFFIYGPNKGLSYVPGAIGGTGQGQTDDVTSGVTLEGAEKVLPLRFLVTDVAATITYLDARVI